MKNPIVFIPGLAGNSLYATWDNINVKKNSDWNSSKKVCSKRSYKCPQNSSKNCASFDMDLPYVSFDIKNYYNCFPNPSPNPNFNEQLTSNNTDKWVPVFLNALLLTPDNYTSDIYRSIMALVWDPNEKKIKKFPGRGRYGTNLAYL